MESIRRNQNEMIKEVAITEDDIINFGKQLWKPDGDEGHWYYLSAIRNRYVRFQTQLSGKVKPQHFMWQVAYGLPPENANIILRDLQKCTDEGCVNPKHYHNYTKKQASLLKALRLVMIAADKQDSKNND